VNGVDHQPSSDAEVKVTRAVPLFTCLHVSAYLESRPDDGLKDKLKHVA